MPQDRLTHITPIRYRGKWDIATGTTFGKSHGLGSLFGVVGAWIELDIASCKDTLFAGDKEIFSV